jgi:hypothetical protein
VLFEHAISYLLRERREDKDVLGMDIFIFYENMQVLE